MARKEPWDLEADMRTLFGLCLVLAWIPAYVAVLVTLGLIMAPFVVVLLVMWPIARLWIYLKEGI